MRKRYYIVNGLQPWSKADEKRLDTYVPTGFVGNVIEKLIQKGYILDEEKMVFCKPDGTKICNLCSAF